MEEDEGGGTCDLWREKNAFRILVVKPEGKRQVGRTRRRWYMDWIGLA
jgi:hypothetical protein